MSDKHTIPVLLFSCFLLWSASALAADFGGAMQLYQKGDYSNALKEFSILANQGDADAQFILGDMYANGQGTEKDGVTAYMWYDIAARNGANGADAIRDDYGTGLSPAEIDKAKQMAGEWRPQSGSGATEHTAAVQSPPPAPAEDSGKSSGGGVISDLARSVTGFLGGGGTPAASDSSTATMGIRGLEADDLRVASPDVNAVQKMESYRVTETEAAGFAGNAQLRVNSVAYIEEPVTAPSSTTSPVKAFGAP